MSSHMFSECLLPVPKEQWPVVPYPPIEVWLSKKFLVQVYQEDNGYKRLSACKVIKSASDNRWVDGISWDELMELKRQCGYGDFDALEVYPKDKDIVNVANMRHLFIPPEPVSFAWRKYNE